MAAAPHPRVGVAAIVFNNQGKIVTGKRKGSHGTGESSIHAQAGSISLTVPDPGTWQAPGGHLEHGESFFACAEREALEETGLKVRGTKVLAVTNDVFAAEGKHYITIFVKCEMEDPTASPQVGSHFLQRSELRLFCRVRRNN